MINKEAAEHYNWGNKCDSWIFCNSKNLSIKLESMPANSKEKLHKHKTKEQFFFILEGRATLSINGRIEILAQKEGILVKPNSPHLIENNGPNSLEFLVITSPNIKTDRLDLKL